MSSACGGVFESMIAMDSVVASWRSSGGGIGGGKLSLEYLDMYRIINSMNNFHSNLPHFI